MERTLFDSQNAGYVQALYEDYARNPDAVPEEWRAFFAAGSEVTSAAGLLPPDGLRADDADPVLGRDDGKPALRPSTQGAPFKSVRLESPGMTPDRVQGLLTLVAQATSFIQAFRDHGHMLSQIDPLGADPPGHPQLDPSFFGTSIEELEQLPASVVMGGDTDETMEPLPAPLCSSGTSPILEPLSSKRRRVPLRERG